MLMAGVFACLGSGVLPADEVVVPLKCAIIEGVAIASAIEMEKTPDSFGLYHATVYLENQSMSSIRISAKQSEAEPCSMLDLATRAFIIVRAAIEHPFNCSFSVPFTSWRFTAIGRDSNEGVLWEDLSPEVEFCIVEPDHFFSTNLFLTQAEIKDFERQGIAVLFDIALA